MALLKVYENLSELTKFNLITSAAGGSFRISWEGHGTISFNVSWTMVGTNMAKVTLSAGQSLVMRVLDSWASDPVKNVAVFSTSVTDPTEMTRIGGEPFTLVKDWNFGANGNITNAAELAHEFTFHDVFNTITNGTNYGAMMTRPVEAPNFGVWNNTAIGLDTFNASLTPPMPSDAQPVDNGRYRSFLSNSMMANVLPLNPAGTTVGPASAHNSGNGSMMAKYALPTGGRLLGKDLVWETRVRMLSAPLGYWFALWTAGPSWNGGPEMDVVEAFSSSGTNVNGDLWQSNPVHPNSTSTVDFSGDWDGPLATQWGSGFALPDGAQTLREWHTFTWVYKADDIFMVYVDGRLIQSGTMPWTQPYTGGASTTEMHFMFDFSHGHTAVSPNSSQSFSTSSSYLTYEIDYSRIWLRDPGAAVP